MSKLHFVSAIALMVNAASAATPPSLAAIRGMIAQQGARTTVENLDRSGQISRIYDLIGSGSHPWIAIVPLFADATDGADGEGLAIELARALPLQAEAVLRVLRAGDGVTGTGRVCSVPFIETSPSWNNAYERRTTRALQRVRDPRLAQRRNECLHDLRG